jgi:hypothetical protein
MSEGMSGRERVVGFNVETSRQAEDAKRDMELLLIIWKNKKSF